MSKRSERRLAWFSLMAGIVVFGGFFGGAAIPSVGIAGIWLTVVVGWTWLSVLSLHLYRAAPQPNC